MTCEDFASLCESYIELYLLLRFWKFQIYRTISSYSIRLVSSQFLSWNECLPSPFFFLSFLPFVHLVGCWCFLLIFGGWVEDAFSLSGGFIYLNRWASSLVSCMVQNFWCK